MVEDPFVRGHHVFFGLGSSVLLLCRVSTNLKGGVSQEMGIIYAKIMSRWRSFRLCYGIGNTYLFVVHMITKERVFAIFLFCFHTLVAKITSIRPVIYSVFAGIFQNITVATSLVFVFYPDVTKSWAHARLIFLAYNGVVTLVLAIVFDATR